MALLIFPPAPVNGQLYPPAPAAGQHQYQWVAADATWRLLGVATGVTPGIYGNASAIPQITIDTTGRITLATDVDISSVYVKTNNPAAYNNYVWPLADGAAGTFLTTDGSGNLSWYTNPYIPLWQLVGQTLEPVSDTYNLTVNAPTGSNVFKVESATGVTSFFNPVTLNTPYFTVSPTTTEVILKVIQGASSTTPLQLEAQDFNFQAYGSSLLNTPSTINLNQLSLDSSVSIFTDGSITVNANSPESFATPPLRGTSGQFLTSNGDGTTSWTTLLVNNYWTDTGTQLEPSTPGLDVVVNAADSTPSVILDALGRATATRGTIGISLDSSYSATETKIVSEIVNTIPVTPADISVDGSVVTLRPWGNSFTNVPTYFQVDNVNGINLTTDIAGTLTPLLQSSLLGDFEFGRHISGGAPSLSVQGSTGDVFIGGRLTVNTGVPIPGSLSSYSFPVNRGVLNQVLFTNADGTTRWDDLSSALGYWTESPGGTELYPSTAGQNVLIRDGSSTNTIEFNSDGWMRATGGDATNPTYSFAADETGFYGGTTAEINIGVDGKLVGKFDDNFFYVYEDIDFVGKSTNPGTNSILENTNTELRFSASSDPSVSKNIVFETASNNQVAQLTTFGDLTVDYGNMSVGSTNVATSTTNITLTIGDNAANKAGKLKLYSTFNGGDGPEFYQNVTTGQVFFNFDSTTDVFYYTATDFVVEVNSFIDGSLTVTDFIRYPSPPPAPPNTNSSGVEGTITWDSNYLYICTALNQWKRVPLSTW